MSETAQERLRGLTELEVKAKLAREGYNEIPVLAEKRFLLLLVEIIKEPMFLLLLACGAIYFILGDIHEALMLLGFVFFVMGITFYQERKTEKALSALRDLSSPRALVIRDGAQKRIAGREVVREDLVILSEGDRVPADMVLLTCNNLHIDESLLTGESVPVRKIACQTEPQRMTPGGDDLPFVYSGTLVVSGTGIAKVKEIGQNTELGKIGKSLQEVEPEKTRLQQEVQSLVKNFAFGGLTLCAIIIVTYYLTRGNLLEGFLAGITLAMSILPEELPVILTVFLALGAWRMSKKNVLTRRQHAIQALGSTTVLAVDKTGTLTINKMTVQKIYNNHQYLEIKKQQRIGDEFHDIVEYAILASQITPFDPMEKAIIELGEMVLSDTEHLHKDWELVREYPLSAELLAISQVWKSTLRADYVIAAKGAPETIFDLCHLDETRIKTLCERVTEMAAAGLRVIAVAKSTLGAMPLPSQQHDFEFTFLGLLGFADPIRSSVPNAVKECTQAGIRVVMITGDYPGTAKNIARQIGLPNEVAIMTGAELNLLSEPELQAKISGINIFARVVPEQKLRIVNALKSQREVVVMTGDGVNDAPALKAAHIGIAMGMRGTDVAREAAAVVLLDDDFSSIVAGVRLGRRIFDNIRKAMAYSLAIHIPIAGITLLAVLQGWPLILLPMHIVFLEMIIDPACSIVFEAQPGEESIMRRPPRNPLEKIFNKTAVLFGVLQGSAVLAAMVTVYLLAMHLQRTEAAARALCFLTLMLGNLALITTNLSWSESVFTILKTKNKALWLVSGGALFFLIAIFCQPYLRQLFRFELATYKDIFLAVGAGAGCLIWFETLKYFKSKYAA